MRNMNKKMLKIWLIVGALIILSGCSKSEKTEPEANKESDIVIQNKIEEMQVMITDEMDQEIIFQLNDSSAAKSLYVQLPITVEVTNYSDNEKIFYPPDELDVKETPLANGPAGTLAYYEPWGDVVMYYGDCGGASGLYALGEAIANGDQIQQLSGTIEISKYQSTNQNSKIKEEDTDLRNQENISSSDNQSGTSTKEEDDMFHVQITVGDQTFTASLYDNTTVRNLMGRLPLTLDMGELHGNEKYYYFSSSLPTEAQRVAQIDTGDLKLYGSDCLVLFYKDFQTTYSYTSLGQIDNTQGLAQALGNRSIQVHFEEID